MFKNPKEFNPSRFIDENGQFKPEESVVLFSLGKNLKIPVGNIKFRPTSMLGRRYGTYGVVPLHCERY